ncbi:MAG: glycosyltransferase [Lachnospiraceae bacterium]|nr:glycosyltransferase [Lachnospiraceae bacterium]
MIITAVAVGTRGDVNPLAELGEEMIRRGHEFRILTSEAFRSLIENKGVTFIKLDTEADHVMKYLVTDYKTSLDFAKGMFRLKKENPEYMAQTLNAINGSDLVMYGTCAAFARHAAEFLKIPCARLFYSPMDPTRQYSLYCDEYDSDKVLKSYDGLPQGMNFMTMIAVNGWRRSVGLPRWRLNSSYTDRIRCGPKPLYIRKRLCSIDEIVDALNDLVSGKYDVKAHEISQEIKKENGIISAADAIEDYLEERKHYPV